MAKEAAGGGAGSGVGEEEIARLRGPEGPSPPYMLKLPGIHGTQPRPEGREAKKCKQDQRAGAEGGGETPAGSAEEAE